MDRVEARVSHRKAEPAAGGATDSITLALVVGGDLTPEQERRLRDVAARCPVHRALLGRVAIAHG